MYSPTFGGMTARWVVKVRGVFYEHFDMQIFYGESLEPRQVLDGSELVNVWTFDAQPKLGSAVIYRRRLSADVENFDVDRYFAGNQAPARSFGPDIVDGRTAGVLSDEDFWAVLGSFPADSGDWHALTEEVASRGREFVLEFANALAVKLSEIDHPLNAAEDPDAIGMEADVASYLMRNWVVVQGREEFERMKAEPGMLRWSDEMGTADELSDVPAEAFFLLTGRRVSIVTSAVSWTGGNDVLWGNSRGSNQVRARNVLPGDDSEEWSWDKLPEPLQRIWGPQDELWDSALARGWKYYTCRLILRGPDSIDELIVMKAASPLTDPEEIADAIEREFRLPAGAVIVARELFETAWTRPHRTLMIKIFAIERRSKMSLDAYVAAHVRPPG